MTRISLALWAAMTAALGLASSGDVARAAELKALTLALMSRQPMPALTGTLRIGRDFDLVPYLEQCA